MAFALEDYTESCKKRRRVLKSPAHSCRYSAYKVYPKRTPGEHLHKSRTEVRCIPTHKNFRVQMNLAFVDLGHGDRIFMIGGIPISGTVDKKKRKSEARLSPASLSCGLRLQEDQLFTVSVKLAGHLDSILYFL